MSKVVNKYLTIITSVRQMRDGKEQKMSLLDTTRLPVRQTTDTSSVLYKSIATLGSVDAVFMQIYTM